ncbi:MAG: AI-2E family transporter [Chitinophagaceae bacterium]|nr:AI-2E family transporter [Chitinophagaceae bacterium]
MNITGLPFYAKFSLNLLGLCLLGALIFLGQDILMPLCFAIVLAILLLPITNWLIKRKIPQVPAMLLSILIAILFFGGIIYFLSSQVAGFMDDLPKIKQNLNHHLNTAQNWIRENFNISKREQNKAVQDATANMTNNGPGMLGSTFLSATSALITIILLPIYTFLIMYYRRLIKKFLIDVFATQHKSKVEEVLEDSKTIIQSYMVGLLIEMAIVAALNAAGFLIIGIQYAIFLAVLAAILNMIPYIGMLVASVICMAITLTSANEISDILWVAVVLTIVQFIDNNFLMPYVVSSKVKINALVSIIGVLVGGALAGVSGMFLSIPGIAIMKAIFDRVDELKPWGMILGDDLSMVTPAVRKRIKRAEKK